jgi:glycosyltransferase involved in cell wall biosynthesis
MMIVDSQAPTTVSVVTPSYNQGAFVEETIESVLSQEGDFLLDYIVVDGGSTDNSVEVIKRYQSLVEKNTWPVRCRGIRYRWMSEKDRGQTDAIEKGLRLAEGEICSWLNSDDILLPDTLSKVVSCFQHHPSAGLVHGKAHFLDASGHPVSEVDTGPTEYDGLAVLNLVCQPAAFFRRSAWEEVGGLKRDLRYTMDHDLWIRMARRFGIGYIPEMLAGYRLHAESKTQSSRHVVEFQRETLDTVMKHYGRAPLNRVYGYCNQLLKSKLPQGWSNANPLVILLSIPFSVIKYIRLNKRIRLDDVRMINPRNLRKLFKHPVGIHTESRQ